ncbi:hypothetical protein [Patulibacter sp.]|uniref:COG1470 family protein n=1 Tax=Patulibacter sp. TaxID=1912859 RepID=UPI00271CF135|nr:hypothetical protein [Patulibacter sp.]MDO9409353.1 hypothetical protein [Patulibacter sp.]
MRSFRPARSRVLGAVGLAVALAAVSAPPASAVFVGEAEDPAGDATVPDPQRDITAAGFGYDPDTGRMGAAIRLRGAPAGAPTTLIAYAGIRTPTGCDRGPAIGFGSDADRSDASWLRTTVDGAPQSRGRLSKAGVGSALQRFDVQSSLLKGLTVDCALISATAPGDAATVYDQLTLDLVGQPALGVRLSGLPSSVQASKRRHALRITVSNSGHGPTGRVRVRLAAVRGVAPTRRTVSLASVAPGKTRTTTVRVRFTNRARLRNQLPVIATAGRLTARAERTVRVVQPDRRPSGGGGGGSGTPATCVQFFPDFSGGSGGSLGLVPCVR